MKRVIFYLIFSICFIFLLFGQTDKKTKLIKFNRISVEIPNDWEYQINPIAKKGIDQLSFYSADRYRVLFITVEDVKNNFDLKGFVQFGGTDLALKALKMPAYKGCSIEGRGEGSEFWGRKNGILNSFIIYKEDENQNRMNIMKIYSYGEIIKNSKQLLSIGVFLIGLEEKSDIVNIVKSIKFLK